MSCPPPSARAVSQEGSGSRTRVFMSSSLKHDCLREGSSEGAFPLREFAPNEWMPAPGATAGVVGGAIVRITEPILKGIESRAEDGRRCRTHRQVGDRDRPPLRQTQIRRPAEAPDCLAHHWLVEPQPPSRPRLRAALPHRRRLRPHGHDPHHAPTAGRKAISLNPNFPDGLWQTLCGPQVQTSCDGYQILLRCRITKKFEVL